MDELRINITALFALVFLRADTAADGTHGVGSFHHLRRRNEIPRRDLLDETGNVHLHWASGLGEQFEAFSAWNDARRVMALNAPLRFGHSLLRGISIRHLIPGTTPHLQILVTTKIEIISSGNSSNIFILPLTSISSNITLFSDIAFSIGSIGVAYLFPWTNSHSKNSPKFCLCSNCFISIK